MRRYLLDTTPLTAYLHGRPPMAALAQPWIRSREASTSILVYGEALEHLKGFPDYPRRYTQLRRLLWAIVPIFVSSPPWSATPTFGASCARPTASV